MLVKKAGLHMEKTWKRVNWACVHRSSVIITHDLLYTNCLNIFICSLLYIVN